MENETLFLLALRNQFEQQIFVKVRIKVYGIVKGYLHLKLKFFDAFFVLHSGLELRKLLYDCVWFGQIENPPKIRPRMINLKTGKLFFSLVVFEHEKYLWLVFTRMSVVFYSRKKLVTQMIIDFHFVSYVKHVIKL